MAALLAAPDSTSNLVTAATFQQHHVPLSTALRYVLSGARCGGLSGQGRRRQGFRACAQIKTNITAPSLRHLVVPRGSEPGSPVEPASETIHRVLWRLLSPLDYDLEMEQARWWVGARGSRTPFHVDETDQTVIMNIVGRKRVVLIARASVLEHRGAFNPCVADFGHSGCLQDRGTQSAVFGGTGARRAVPKHTVELGPGEAIVIPRGWYHDVENLEATVSLIARPFRLKDPLDEEG